MNETELDGVAIVGMAGRFPGADSVAALWTSLCTDSDSISRFSANEISAQADADLRRHPRYVAARGVISDADRFDAAFFGVPAREALLIDPQQRLLLELAWNALEDAGIDPQRYPGSIGVYAGTSNNDYRKLLALRPDIVRSSGEFAAMLASEKDYVATRIAHRIGLTGPAIGVYTACSTSLVAVAQAWYALMSWQCDAALAGGINLVVPQESGYVPVEGGMESDDGVCRPFDADANGTLFSSGGGVVVLKRLADAVADGDPIHAVIRGVGLNNDGADKASFTAPSARGQAAAIRLALASAGVSAETIGYVEAHGTGTPLGDPIEVDALSRAFAEDTDQRQYCWLGSIKGHLGHLVAGSGVAGLIKATLALKHGQLPPTANYQQSNAQIDFSTTPFKVVDRMTAWPRGAHPRRAGVSSFGVGGTNAHVVLEEAPPLPAAGSSAPVLLVVSARDDDALRRRASELATRVRESRVGALADIGYTLALGRRAFDRRAFVVAASSADAADQLAAMPPPRSEPLPQPRLLFAFPGQGSQHVGMARALVECEQEFARAFDEVCALASAALGRDLRALILASGDQADGAALLLADTRYTQPALFAVEYAMAIRWRAIGVEPDVMIGHSIGEYVAACLAGVFTLDDAVTLVVARAHAMALQPGGAMLSVRASAHAVRVHLDAACEIAVVNGPELIVVGGPDPAVAALAARLDAHGIASTRLQVSHAFHTAAMDGAVSAFRDAFAGITLRAPNRPFYSCVSGRPITDAQATSPEYWGRQIRSTVQFMDCIEHAASGGPLVVLEVGPGQALTALVRRQAAAHVRVVASLGPVATTHNAVEHALRAVGELWCAGVAVDWSALFAHADRRTCSLPGYPFRGERYWIDTVSVAAVAVDAPAMGASAPMPVHAEPDRHHGTRDGVLERNDILRAELRAMFVELSGEPFAAEDDELELVALGLDSLSLTQAVLVIERRYTVKLRLRRLMEDLGSVARLAAFLDDALPATDTAAATVQRSTMPAPGMSRSEGSSAADLRERPFGAAPRITTQRRTGFTADQSEWLVDFIARYNARSGKSKAFSQAHRKRMADPRVVTGFNPLWKDLVYPIVVDSSKGARLRDIDGNDYIDLLSCFGANLLGYQPDDVLDAMKRQLDAGIEVGPQHPLAAEVAELIHEFTGLERIAFCNTGSEAVMGAMRIARTVTGRSLIAIFTNSYHGIFDEVIVRGTRQLRSISAAPGILASAVENVLVLDYASDEALATLRSRAGELAAIMIEPVQNKTPTLQPRAFVHALREIADSAGCALIFDEVVTGFRLAPGGAQEFYGVRADIATFGKVIGGGLPFAAIGGSAPWLDALDGGDWQYGDDSFPEAGVTYFAGTFVRHPLALAAAKASLLHLKRAGRGIYDALNGRTQRMVDALNAGFAARNAPVRAVHCASLWRLAWDDDQPFTSLFYYLARFHGLHLYEQFGHFVTTAMDDAMLDRIVEVFLAALDELMPLGFIRARANDTTGIGALAGALSPTAEHRTAPTTEPQREIWLAARSEVTASLAYNEAVSLRLHGRLDEAMLRRALQATVDRHESLRCTFAEDGRELHVARASAAAFSSDDLRDLDATARDAAIAEILHGVVTTTFDLEQGPLFRAQLVRVGDDEHLLVLSGHHIVCDGWSFSVIVHEVAARYSATASDAVDGGAESFVDFAIAQARLGDGVRQQTELAYWAARYAHLPPALDLPTDRTRPRERTFASARIDRTLDARLVDAIRRTAAGSSTSFFTILVAAFGALLQRLSGQEDFVIGIPAAGQAEQGRTTLVGHCVNLLPLRVVVPATVRFEELLQHVRSELLDAFDHQHITYGTLLRTLNPPRAPGRLPLVSVVFNLDEAPNPRTFRFGDLDVGFASVPRAFENFELFINAVQDAGQLRIECQFKTDLHDAATIDAWLDGYEMLLRGVVDDSSRAIAQLPILSDSALANLDALQPAQTPYPVDRLAHEYFERQADLAPERAAVRDSRVQWTYAQLEARANRIANVLRARGIGRGARVGLGVARGVDMVASVLAVLKAGAGYVPLDPAFPAERLQFMVDDAELAAVVVDDTSPTAFAFPAERVVSLQRDTLLLEQASSSRPVRDEAAADPASIAYVIFTSGSSGRPKGVCVPHRATSNFITAMQVAPGMRADDRLLAVTTLSFDIAFMEILLPLSVGAEIVVASHDEVRDPAALRRRLEESAATVMQATPSGWRILINSGWQGGPGFRAISGGEPMLVDLAQALLARCEEVWNGYGPTETTVYSTFSRVVEPERGIHIGVPIANTRIDVLDADGARCPLGVIGELYIGGDGVSAGYLRRAELDAERLVADPASIDPRMRRYRTGDRGRWLAMGVLDHHGRIDHQVKVRGYRIELGEIESHLATHAAVARCVVTVREDTPGDARIVAYVVPSAQMPSMSSLRDHLRAQLPYYMLPQHVVELAELPVLPNGKINRAALPPPLEHGEPGTEQAAVAPPMSPAETLLADVWRDVLDVSGVTIDDNFFELGGHSLSAVDMVARVEKATGTRLNLLRIATSTLRALAAELPASAVAVEDTVRPSTGERLLRMIGFGRGRT